MNATPTKTTTLTATTPTATAHPSYRLALLCALSLWVALFGPAWAYVPAQPQTQIPAMSPNFAEMAAAAGQSPSGLQQAFFGSLAWALALITTILALFGDTVVEPNSRRPVHSRGLGGTGPDRVRNQGHHHLVRGHRRNRHYAARRRAASIRPCAAHPHWGYRLYIEVTQRNSAHDTERTHTRRSRARDRRTIADRGDRSARRRRPGRRSESIRSRHCGTTIACASSGARWSGSMPTVSTSPRSSHIGVRADGPLRQVLTVACRRW